MPDNPADSVFYHGEWRESHEALCTLGNFCRTLYFYVIGPGFTVYEYLVNHLAPRSARQI